MSYPRARGMGCVEMLEARRLLSGPGDVDATFGAGGRLVGSPFEPVGGLLPTDLAVQGDGKLLFSGFGLGDVGSVVRVNADGTVDKTFGGEGLANSGFGPYIAEGLALAVGPAGKIAVAGKAGPLRKEEPNEATLVVYDSAG